MIKIVNYGSGNIQAIANVYKRIGIACEVAEHPEQLESASGIILPGVGAFDESMSHLERSGMRDTLTRLVTEKEVPVLGICVGMQLMAHGSEEGQRTGLGWINGTVKLIDVSSFTHKPKLPHMGWNSVEPHGNDPLFTDVDTNRGFYFLHSYCFSCEDEADILAHARYGKDFTCSVRSGNIYGVQFHPEKSHANGVKVLRNFAALVH